MAMWETGTHGLLLFVCRSFGMDLLRLYLTLYPTEVKVKRGINDETCKL